MKGTRRTSSHVSALPGESEEISTHTRNVKPPHPVLDLLEEIDDLPEVRESRWTNDSVLMGFLNLTKKSRNKADREFFGRKGFTVPELVRNELGKDVNSYDQSLAGEEINQVLGFSLIDDPADQRTTLVKQAAQQGIPYTGERPRQIPGPPYVKGSLMDLGIIVFQPRGGNKGRGFAFSVDVERARSYYEDSSADNK